MKIRNVCHALVMEVLHVQFVISFSITKDMWYLTLNVGNIAIGIKYAKQFDNSRLKHVCHYDQVDKKTSNATSAAFAGC